MILFNGDKEHNEEASDLALKLQAAEQQCEFYRLETHRWSEAVRKDRIEHETFKKRVSYLLERIEQLETDNENLLNQLYEAMEKDDE